MTGSEYKEEMTEKHNKGTDEGEQKKREEGKEAGGSASKDDKKNAKDCTEHWEDAVHLKNSKDEYRKFKRDEAKIEDAETQDTEEQGSDHSGSAESRDDEDEPNTKKRGRGANQNGPNKKQKSNGSRKGPRGTAGDKTRVPKQGQKVQWHALPGYVDGEVVEVVYEEKTVDGKKVKASKEDPRVVLKSSSSGKIAVHKPEAVYFD